MRRLLSPPSLWPLPSELVGLLAERLREVEAQSRVEQKAEGSQALHLERQEDNRRPSDLVVPRLQTATCEGHLGHRLHLGESRLELLEASRLLLP